MDINPILEDENHHITINKVLDKQETKKLYTIFTDINNIKDKFEIFLNNDATVEDAISKTINLDAPEYKGV